MRVFLSYGHDEHASLALRLKEDLQTHGHEVWFDLERLRPSGDWERYIEQGLEWASERTGEGRFLLLMTPHSVRRPNGYCLNELARAYARELPIIPVMVVDVEAPLSIARIQWIDMRNGVPVQEHEAKYVSRFEQVLRAIETNELDFEGVQSRLLSYFQPLPYGAELARHLTRFAGREWVMAEIDKWLAGSSPVLWITGEAGVGKSALAAWICDRRPEVAAFHYCRYGNSDRVNPRRALLSIAYQLSTQFPDYAERLNASGIAGLKAETSIYAVFEKLFVDLLDRRQNNSERPVVILIDALDEATESGKNELASIIGSEFRKTPSWLRLIVTSRPYEAAVNFPLQALDPWKLDANRPENIEDIRLYLRRELRPFAGNAEPSPDLVEKIIKKSEGIFLYVDWVRQELANGRLSLNEPDKFPQGLGGIYAGFFRRYFPDPEKYAATYRPLLEAICAAREPLEIPYVADLFGWSVYSKNQITSALGSLFPVDGGHVRPFHQSVRDWVTDDSRAGDYFASVAEGHKRLAGYGWLQFQKGVAAMPRYSIVHLPVHLGAVPGREGDLRKLLLDFEWVQAKLNATDITALLRDYELVGGGGRPSTPAAVSDPSALMRGALRLSAHVLAARKSQLAPQLNGRLLIHSDDGEIKLMLDSASNAETRPWLRPVAANLNGPGGALVSAMVGHEKLINAAITSDGRRAVSASFNGTIELWDLTAAVKIGTVRRNNMYTLEGGPQFDRFVLSGSGRYLITVSRHFGYSAWELRTTAPSDDHSARSTAPTLDDPDNRVLIPAGQSIRQWDPQHGFRDFCTTQGRVTTLTIKRSNGSVIAAFDDKTIHLFDMRDGSELRAFRGPEADSIVALFDTFADDLILCVTDKAVSRWDWRNGASVNSWQAAGSIRAAANVKRGKEILLALADQTLRLYDVESGAELSVLDRNSSYISSLKSSQDGHIAVSTSGDGALRVWDTSCRVASKFRNVHEAQVNEVIILPGRSRGVSASDDGTLKIWALHTGQEIGSLRGHTRPVVRVLATPDGETLISSSRDGSIRIWDTDSGTLKRTLSNAGGTSALALAGDGRSILSARGADVEVWSVDTGNLLSTLRGHTGPVTDIAFAGENNRAVSASEDQTLIVWDTGSGQPHYVLKGHTWDVFSVKILPDARRVVSAAGGWFDDWDKTLRVWDLQDGTTSLEFEEPVYEETGSIEFSAIAVSSDGKTLVSGHNSIDLTSRNPVTIWDLDSGRQRRLLMDNFGAVVTISLSSAAELVCAASNDRTVRVWRTSTGELIADFTVDSPIRTCAIDPHGRTIMAGDATGQVHILNLENLSGSTTSMQ